MTNTYKQKRVEHSFIAKSLHWVFVVMFGYGVFKQIESKEQLNDIVLLRSEILFATIFLALIILCFIYMKERIQNFSSFRDTEITSYSSKVYSPIDVYCSFWNCPIGFENRFSFLAGLSK